MQTHLKRVELIVITMMIIIAQNHHYTLDKYLNKLASYVRSKSTESVTDKGEL